MQRDVALHLGPSWSSLALRGVASVIFGLIAFLRPGITLFALAIVFGAYAFVDGVTALAIALHRGPIPHRALLVFDGLLGIGAGVITLLWPGITLFALILVMGIRFVVMGGIEIIDGFRLRDVQASARALLVLAGVASLLLGVLTLGLPGLTAVVLMTLLGIYAFVFGLITIVLAFRVRHVEHVEHVGTTAPA